MNVPAPVRLIEYLIEHRRFPILVMGSAIFVPLILLFTLTGAIFPSTIESRFSSPLEIVGLFIMMSILPAYLMMCMTAWLRNSKEIYKKIGPLLAVDVIPSIDRYQFTSYWPLSVVVAIIFALTSNISWGSLSFNSGYDAFVVSVCLVFGQIFMWGIVGLTLFLILHEDLILHRYGKRVNINLYDLDNLNGFGSAGLNGILMVVGALALTVLQSLDLEFRLVNYRNALYVSIPSAFIMFLLPIWIVHRRIKFEKKRELERINGEMRTCSNSLQPDALLHLNGLLQRRDLIRGLRSWPMDLSMFSRVVLYGLIPPLAWAGAALTELLLVP